VLDHLLSKARSRHSFRLLRALLGVTYSL